jgi:hypothetical protein
VFVRGEQVVRDGHLTKVSEEDILREVAATSVRVAARLDMRSITKLRWPVE